MDDDMSRDVDRGPASSTGRLGAVMFACLALVGLSAASCGLDEREVELAGDAGGIASEREELEDSTSALTPAPCTAGEGSCTSLTSRAECGADGTWGASTACEFVCVDGRCSGACSPGAIRCLTTTQRQSCSSSGAWTTPEQCLSACVEGRCAGECVPGAQRCVSDSEVQRCTEAGQWGAPFGCPGACSGAGCVGECAAGSVECFSISQLRACNEMGQWGTPLTCPAGCSDDRCAGECVPGALRCAPESGAPQRCDDAGAWLDAPECAPGAACPPGALARCEDACVSLESDPEHCGRCGHGCAGGECVAGRCQPVELGTGFSRPSSVALSDTHVYFRDGAASASARILRIPKAGGAAEVVAAALGDRAAPTLGGDQVYFVAADPSGAGRVRRANLDGSGALDFSPLHAEGINRLITPGLFVYYTVRQAGATTVFRAPLLSAGQTGAGTESSFEVAPGPLLSMTVVSGCLYYVDQNTQSVLSRKCSASDMAAARYTGAGALSFQSSAANDGTFLYFVDAGRGLLRVPLSSMGNAELIAAGAVADPTASADALFYFAATGGPSAPGCSASNALYQLDKMPGSTPRVVLPPPLACPTQVAVDDGSLFWSTEDGRVLRVAR